ncbi:MAG: LysE family transporter [Roseiflexaceae bacterium]
MLTFLVLGISFGLSASVNPGPSLTLAIARALRDGARAGVIVTLAPLCTDAPIIAVAALLVGSLPQSAFGWLGVAGGAYIVWLGIHQHDGNALSVIHWISHSSRGETVGCVSV